MNKKLKFLDFFAGIGGFRSVIEDAGGTCIGFSEIDKTAIKYYKANHSKQDIELGDIKSLLSIDGSIDLMTAGVPCQSWSIAGKNKGFEDPRGQLWFHTLNALDKYKPTMFIFENVKGLSDPRNSSALDLIKSEISKRGYFFKIFILNSNDFGTPQERVRLFIVGTLDKKQFEKMKDPVKNVNQKNLNEYFSLGLKKTFGINCLTLSDVRDGKNTIHSWDLVKTSEKEKSICMLLLQNRRKKFYGSKDGNPLSLQHFKSLDKSINQKDIDGLVSKNILILKDNKYDFKNSKISSGINGIYRIYSPNSLSFSTLTATGINDWISNHCFATKEEFIENVYKTKNYRKITKEEALLLQGFPKDFILPLEDKKWMKLIGNSVPLHTIRALINILK